jgi:hypothetical protein
MKATTLLLALLGAIALTFAVPLHAGDERSISVSFPPPSFTHGVSGYRLTDTVSQPTTPRVDTQTVREGFANAVADLEPRVALPAENKHYTCSTDGAVVLVCRDGFCSTEYDCGRWKRCVEGPARCV